MADLKTTAQYLAVTKAKELGLADKTLSFGKSKGNFLSVIGDAGRKLTWSVSNPHSDARVFLIGSAFLTADAIGEGAGSKTEKLDSSKLDILNDFKLSLSDIGLPFLPETTDVPAGPAGPNLWAVKLESKDSRQNPKGFYFRATQNSYQITKLRMTSTNISNGAANPSNYNNPVQHFWLNPFELPVPEPFSLRVTQNNRITAEQYAEVDFVAAGYNALVGPEDVLGIRIEGGTKLDLEIFIGAEMSTAQEFYRKVEAGVQVVRPFAQQIARQ